MEKQTAGRKALGDFAPQFAALNDDVLFGEVWAKEDELSPKLRSIATVSALVGKGTAGDALRYHLQTARKHGVTREEMAALLTHLAFYAGWPNAWAAFPVAKEVYADATDADGRGGFFGLGEPNDAYAKYFTGRSYLNVLSKPGERLSSATSHSSRAAAISGISTTLRRAAARSSSASMARAGIRRRERHRRASHQATSSRSPQASSTGTVPSSTAGSPTSPLRSRARRRATSGASPSRKPSIRRIDALC